MASIIFFSFSGEITLSIKVSTPRRMGTLISEDFLKYDSPFLSITFENNNRMALEPISMAANFKTFISPVLEETV